MLKRFDPIGNVDDIGEDGRALWSDVVKNIFEQVRVGRPEAKENDSPGLSFTTRQRPRPPPTRPKQRSRGRRSPGRTSRGPAAVAARGGLPRRSGRVSRVEHHPGLRREDPESHVHQRAAGMVDVPRPRTRCSRRSSSPGRPRSCARAHITVRLTGVACRFGQRAAEPMECVRLKLQTGSQALAPSIAAPPQLGAAELPSRYAAT